MPLPSVSVILPIHNKDSFVKGLHIVNGQTVTDFQLVIVVNDKDAYTYLNQNDNAIKAKDRVIRYIECDKSQLSFIGLGLCTGDFVWVCDANDNTSCDFVERMTVIQNNLGCDVIISDYHNMEVKDENVPQESDTVTLYVTPGQMALRKETVDIQWIKFFRKSLLDDYNTCNLGYIVSEMAKSVHSVCYYNKKMFYCFKDRNIVILPTDDTICSFDMPYEELIGYDDLQNNEKIPITIGICAYNEQFVIERAIRSIFKQHDDSFVIDRIIVVSSGSTDDTNKIIDRMSKEYELILPIYQERKEGKNSAINELVRNSRTGVIVLYNADNILASEYSLDMLIRPLFNPRVGITGGHPIPLNSSDSLADFTVRMMWMMHHTVSVISPNMGELIAFRNLNIQLPTDTQGDEGIIRHTIESKGYETVYVPQALLFNKGPTSIPEYIKQRKRVNVGERNMLRRIGFVHSTHSYSNLAKAFLATIKQMGMHPLRYIFAMSLEMLTRFKAKVYADNNEEDMFSWEQIKSTKKI